MFIVLCMSLKFLFKVLLPINMLITNVHAEKDVILEIETANQPFVLPLLSASKNLIIVYLLVIW